MNIMVFFSEVRKEFSKISWASKNEVFVFLFVIVLVVLISALFFSFMDFIFLKLIKLLLEVIYGV